LPKNNDFLANCPLTTAQFKDKFSVDY